MKLHHFILALLVIVVWGFNFVVIKVGLEEISPLFLGFARIFLTSIPAIFFVKRPTVPFRMILSYGLIMFALQFSLLFVGMYAGVTPGLASLLSQIQVFFTALLAVVFFGEKFRPWQVVGALISLSGIALVAMNLKGSATAIGFLLVIGSAASWGAGNIISKKIGNVNMFSLVIWSCLIAWPPLLLLSFLIDGTDKIFYTFQNLTWASGGAVLYLTYLSTLLGFGIWSWLLHRLPLGTIAPFTFLVPVFGILSSGLVLDEPLQLWKIFATLLVIAGLCISLLGPRIFTRIRKK